MLGFRGNCLPDALRGRRHLPHDCRHGLHYNLNLFRGKHVRCLLGIVALSHVRRGAV